MAMEEEEQEEEHVVPVCATYCTAQHSTGLACTALHCFKRMRTEVCISNVGMTGCISQVERFYIMRIKIVVLDNTSERPQTQAIVQVYLY